MKLFRSINWMKLFNKIGYIGTGMMLAAILEYGAYTETILGLVLAICVVLATTLAIHNKWDLNLDDTEEETI